MTKRRKDVMFYVEGNKICMKLGIVYRCRAICHPHFASPKCKFGRIYILDGFPVVAPIASFSAPVANQNTRKKIFGGTNDRRNSQYLGTQYYVNCLSTNFTKSSLALRNSFSVANHSCRNVNINGK